MGYATPLESRIAKKTTRAILDFQMIEAGDRVMVGLSGGKDSWALLQILHVLQRRAPIDFTIVAVTVDSGFGEVMDDLLDPDATPCSLCARLRRGVLYRLATELGATKIALGHHSDDFIETLLINLFFAGALKAMPAKLLSDDKRHVVIRPLVYVSEDEARLYAKACELPVIGCCCPVCGDLSLQRQRIKRLLMDLERDHPGVKSSLLKALANVMPRHLLDRRLNPLESVKHARGSSSSNDAAVLAAMLASDSSDPESEDGAVTAARLPSRIIPLVVSDGRSSG